MDNKRISVLDIVVILLEKKWLLFISLFLISVVAIIGSLFMEKYYTASATLLPSKTSSFSNPLSSLMTDIPLGNLMKSFDFLGANSDNDQLFSILESRRLAEKVIRTFDLEERYSYTTRNHYYLEDVLRSFYGNFEVFETDLKNISISFTDTNPEFAANVVNYIIAELDSINSELSRNSARNTRIFFEKRIDVVKKDLDSAHASFAAFQEKNNLLDIEHQALSTIEALSLVETQILSNDIAIEVLKNQYGMGNYEVKELINKRNVLENRMKHYLDSGSGQLILPLKNAPRLSIDYTNLMKNVKVQEMLHAFLLQNFEQAKLKEANNTPTITVLEYAKIPQKKSRPKRMIICILVFSIGFVFISSFILISKWYELQREQQSQTYLKIIRIIKLIWKW